jgi:hypothetical protein
LYFWYNDTEFPADFCLIVARDVWVTSSTITQTGVKVVRLLPESVPVSYLATYSVCEAADTDVHFLLLNQRLSSTDHHLLLWGTKESEVDTFNVRLNILQRLQEARKEMKWGIKYIILWRIDPLLGNGSINTLQRKQILSKHPSVR